MDTYYLTGTTPNPGDPREAADPYNIGLGEESIVGYHMQLWRSKDLVEWEYLGTPFSLLDGYWAKKMPKAFEGADRTRWHLWAPEVHFINGQLAHCPHNSGTREARFQPGGDRRCGDQRTIYFSAR